MDCRPIALGWVHPEAQAPDWDVARVRRLARHLGYRLVWPPIASHIPLVDQVRAAYAEAVITPSTDHLDILTLHSVMSLADVETVTPRLSFARWPAHSTQSRS
ncbi:hypothetical protein NONO_c31710 [Nocardia nova SH22a]|uniref:Uncharacterized protein n=1 Tax=Nocardia nova SH22a TaxID=1415166 RepID=W5TG55_9NOCA|nr:hypothetical protein [Nocardia nova]AHH17958.1 hypothetical protein NONO_c31710 [Nocardia nova SH22a]